MVTSILFLYEANRSDQEEGEPEKMVTKKFKNTLSNKNKLRKATKCHRGRKKN